MSPPKISIANSSQKSSRSLIEENVKQILKILGEDSNRPGLVDTPKRVARAWEDFLSGYFHANQPVEMVKSALFKIHDNDDDDNDFEQEKKNFDQMDFTFDKNVANSLNGDTVVGTSEISSQFSNSKSDLDESSTESLCPENEFDVISTKNLNGISKIDKYDVNSEQFK
eukprot:TRINITY_DN46300_c0_g4_i1.p1 TRINITY_DN46300_c0_g4~~TRINITY_DN46300_c0_g4_i1.p1  ORF type:complete len:169 (-),score=37.78 TRINITY_DN46300_c0_g4_i1:75-581(-)